jgi:hypothetical protein
MCTLVRAELATVDADIAEYIASNKPKNQTSKSELSMPSCTVRTKAPDQLQLSDGIEQMPRRLTDAERRADHLFLHLQVISYVLLLLFPVLGYVQGGWTVGVVGLVVGWLIRVWIRYSMGIRGSDPNDGFFIRMKERAGGARRGILEILLESVRQRSFTQGQCTAIIKVWDNKRKLIEAATSEEEKIELLRELDAEIKRISYKSECRTPSEEDDYVS